MIKDMQVLEKILEEIKKNAVFEDLRWDCIRIARVEEIIRKHMNVIANTKVAEKRLINANVLEKEVRNFFLTITGNPHQAAVVRECKNSFRRMIDEQPTIYANDDGDWIPCSKRLPEVPEGLEDMDCPEFNVTIKGAKEATTLKYSWDGTWFDDNGNVYDVIAWQPLPEVYEGQA